MERTRLQGPGWVVGGGLPLLHSVLARMVAVGVWVSQPLSDPSLLLSFITPALGTCIPSLLSLLRLHAGVCRTLPLQELVVASPSLLAVPGQPQAP